MLISLYRELTSGYIMSPPQQDLTQISRMFQSFMDQSTERMIIIVVAGVVLFLIINAYFGNKRAREFNQFQADSEKRQDAMQQSMLELLSNQMAAGRERQLQIDIQADRFAAVSQQNTEVLEVQANILRKIDTRVNDAALLAGSVSSSIETLMREGTRPAQSIMKGLEEHRSFSSVAVAEILKDLGDVKENIVAANKRLEVIEFKLDNFPRFIEFKSDIDELKASMEKLNERCAEVQKRATDELPLTDIAPVEKKAEDASALTPGAEAA